MTVATTTPSPPVPVPGNDGPPISGLRRAAIFLVQLGRDNAARIMAMLPERMVEDLTGEIVRLRDVNAAEARSVMVNAHEELSNSATSARGGLEMARQLLADSLGAERAGEIMERLGASLAEMPFEGIRRADARQLLSFLGDEHPQTIALVLAHLAPQQSALVLSGLSPELQANVAFRIASMEPASPEVIRLVERELERRMTTVLDRQEMSSVGGVAPLVAIINRADRSTERMILEGLETVNSELAEIVRAQMFIFEDILTLDDKAIQLVLRNVESGDLALALKGVPPAVKDKISRNLSTRAAENLGEEIELLGAVRLKQVEEAQAKIVQEIRALEQSGQIMIMRGSDEAMGRMSITRRTAGGLTSSPQGQVSAVIDAAVAKVSVRPARLDRPLRQGQFDAGYTDPHLEEVVEAAVREARESAQAQGYAAGWTQGRQAASAQAAVAAQAAQQQLEQLRVAAGQQISNVLRGLADAAAAMSQRSAAEWSEVADVLGDGALQLAQALLARELQSVDGAMMLNVRAALQLLADPSDAVVHLHPQDAAMITDVPGGVRIVPDPAVPAGGVVALTPAQRLRLDLPEAIAAAQVVLHA